METTPFLESIVHFDSYTRYVLLHAKCPITQEGFSGQNHTIALNGESVLLRSYLMSITLSTPYLNDKIA
jgi:hypothetical protein